MPLTLPSELFITSREAAKLSGFVSDYITRLCRSGKIDGRQDGRAWRIDRRSFERFLETHTLEKEQQARLLAKSREEEYQAIQALKQTRALPRRAPLSLRLNHPLPYFEESTTTPVPFQQSLVALMATLLIMTGGAYAADEHARNEAGRVALLAARNTITDVSFSFGIVKEVALVISSESNTMLAGVAGSQGTVSERGMEHVRTITITATDPSTSEVSTRVVYTVAPSEPLSEQAADETARVIAITAIDPETSESSKLAYVVGGSSEVVQSIDAPPVRSLALAHTNLSATPSFSIELRFEDTRKAIASVLGPAVTVEIAFGNFLIKTSEKILHTHQSMANAWVAMSREIPRATISGVLHVGAGTLALTNAVPGEAVRAYHGTYDAALGAVGHTALAYDLGKEALVRAGEHTRAQILAAGKSMRLVLQEPPHSLPAATPREANLAAAGAGDYGLMAAVESAAQSASSALASLFDSAGEALASWLVDRERGALTP